MIRENHASHKPGHADFRDQGSRDFGFRGTREPGNP